jgi:DNA-binding IscR family transcriptional regulator
MFEQPVSVRTCLDIVLFVVFATRTGVKCTAQTIAKAISLAPGFDRTAFVQKCVKQLAKADIVHTTRGVGTRFVRDPREITVSDIVNACGGTTSSLSDYFGKDGATYDRLVQRILDTKVSTLDRRAEWNVDESA